MNVVLLEVYAGPESGQVAVFFLLHSGQVEVKSGLVLPWLLVSQFTHPELSEVPKLTRCLTRLRLVTRGILMEHRLVSICKTHAGFIRIVILHIEAMLFQSCLSSTVPLPGLEITHVDFAQMTRTQ